MVNATRLSYNISQEGLSSLSSMDPTALIGAIVFIIIPLTLFLLFKNFRRAVYGGILNGFLILNFYFAKSVTTQYKAGNPEPLNWVVRIVAFIVLSVLLGVSVEKLPFIKKIEKELDK